MGVYRHDDRPEMPSFSRRVRGPAAWGGIGCVMAILLPILSYFAALLTLDYNDFYHWFVVPPAWLAKPWGLPVSAVILILTIGYMVAFYAIYALIYAILYRAAGISPYTVLDLDRPQRTHKRLSQKQQSKLMAVLLFFVAMGLSYWLVRSNITHQWFTVPPSWLVPGPQPYAGLYILALLLVWAFLWAFWGIVQTAITAFLRAKQEDITGDE